MAGVSFQLDRQRFARDMAQISRRFQTASGRARHAVALQMAKDTEPYVPAKTKSLANRVIVQEDVIIYPGPYARFLYYGKLMIDPNTGSPFAPKGASKVVTGTDLNISKAVHGKAQSRWFEASKAQNLPKWRRVAGKAVQREFDG